MQWTHRRRLSAFVAATSLVSAIGVAHADDVSNNLDDTIDATHETASIVAGGTVDVGFFLRQTNTSNGVDDVAGCNANTSNPAVATLSIPAGVTTVPSGITSVTFTGCFDPTNTTVPNPTAGEIRTVRFTSSTVTPVTPFQLGISGMSGGRTTGNQNHTNYRTSVWDTAPSWFSLTVLPADSTPPVITPSLTGTAGAVGWFTSDVDLAWSVVDEESAVTRTSGCDAQTFTAETAGTSATCEATSTGGTARVGVTVRIDKTGPVVDPPALSGIEGDNGWFTSAVTATATATDAISGVAGGAASCGSVTADHADAQTLTCTATNGAGLMTMRSVEVRKDGMAPTTAVVGPVAGADYRVGHVPAISCSSTDDHSGLEDEATETTIGTIGNVTTTCSGAKDRAGNVGQPASVTYRVVYDWSGFLRPVDPLPTINVVKGGSAVPVKFRLGGDQGMGVFSSQPHVSAQASCGSAPSDPVEQLVTAGHSQLQFDPTTATYTYVWKTDRAWTSGCRTLTLRLADGSVQRATFQFTR